MQREEKNNNSLNEDSKNYKIINSRQTNNEHDKTYRKLLSNKEDTAHIINEALKLDKEDQVIAEELEKYSTNFITNEFKDRQADIVYKLKNRNLFFLIEHQNKVDYSMPYRIEEYKLKIMKSAIDMKKIKTRSYEVPTVIPIVIYTGKARWKARLYLDEVKDRRFRGIDLLKYNLLDINEYEKKELLESEYFIDKIFLMEKTKNLKELFEIAKRIIKSTYKEENKKDLSMILKTTVKKKLGEEKVQELLKEMKGEDSSMLENVAIMIDREMNAARRKGMREGRQKGIKQGIQEGRQQGMQQGMLQGIKQGISKVIINMLLKGMSVEDIQELTGATNKEIEKVKKTIEK